MANTIQEKLAATGTPTDQPIQYVDTIDAYNKWAEVYDTDGNFLQALDTLEMNNLLPLFLERISATQPIKLVDLGCGTGRNTLRLHEMTPPEAQIVGLDASPSMLDIARGAIKKASSDEDRVILDLFDLRQSPPNPPPSALGASGIISTLVLEHIPLPSFFSAAATLLRPGGLLLITNMHSDMGAISQAGFVDASGTKIRPVSYCHTVRDVVEEGVRMGFRVERLEGERKDVRERAVEESLVEELGRRARKWVGVKVWFGVCFRKV